MNKIIHRLISTIAALALTIGSFVDTRALSQSPVQIISGNFTSTIVLDGHKYDGTIIDGAVVHNTGGDGITLRNVDNVIIRNCEIYGVSEGIAFSSLGTTNNTVIENCNIHDTGRNGIIVKQHATQGSNQTNVVIRGNTITRTGQSSTSGAYHGIYMQATDNVIIGNTIDVSTGNGVSIRSSGTVSGNRISNTAKSCVRYFSDNATGTTKKLLVENNLCVNPPANYPGLSILWGDNLSVVTDYVIRFNTIIGGQNSIQVQSQQFSAFNVSVYGNLFNKSLITDYIDYNAGNILSTLPLNTDYSPPIGYPVSVQDYPNTDINGKIRTASQLDAGAFDFSSTASPILTTIPSTATTTSLATPTKIVPSTTPTSSLPATATQTVTMVPVFPSNTPTSLPATATQTVTKVPVLPSNTPAPIQSTTIPPIVPAGQNAVDMHVKNGTDDVEESSTGIIYVDSTDLELINAGNNQIIGIRFTGVDIPKGATITNAYLQFKVDETSSTSTKLFIQGEASSNAPAFTKTTRNVSSRLKTSKIVNWLPVSWLKLGVAGVDQRTPNLAPIIQEIINQSGWATGNSMVLIITGSGKRVAQAFENNPAGAPVLHIEYSVTASAASNATMTATTIPTGSPTASPTVVSTVVSPTVTQLPPTLSNTETSVPPTITAVPTETLIPPTITAVPTETPTEAPATP